MRRSDRGFRLRALVPLGTGYRQAIASNSSYATAHQWYAEYLALMGRFDEGLAEIKVPEDVDPLSVIIIADHGVILYLKRQYDNAISQFRKALELEPSFMYAQTYLAIAQAQRGMYKESIAELERIRASDDSMYASAFLVYSYAHAGRRVDAARVAEEIMRVSRYRHVDAGIIVVAYIGLGDKEKALAWLRNELAEHSVGLTSLKVNPMYDPLRSDPRFNDVMRRVGLAP